MDNYHYKYCGGVFSGFTFLTTPCSEIQTDFQSKKSSCCPVIIRQQKYKGEITKRRDIVWKAKQLFTPCFGEQKFMFLNIKEHILGIQT